MLASQPVASPKGVTTRVLDATGNRLPLMILPGASRSPDDLRAFLDANKEWLEERLREHGAILFRGFDVMDEVDFEQIIRGVDDELQDEYFGTSPRDAQTRYVFSASELPSFYPIPQHCEMTFVREPPRRLFFCCLVAPQGVGGETPLTDFRAVYRDLDPEVRSRFEERGIRIIRNYGPPGKKSRDLWQLKSWEEIFQTTDKAVVERKCEEQGFEPVWRRGDKLTLISTQRATRQHPQTGAMAWFSHLQVFHLSTAAAELRRIRKMRGDLRALGLGAVARVVVGARKRLLPADRQSMHCTYADGEEIPDADVEHVRDTIWKHMVAIPWERGDIVAIDNYSVAHGRLPYRGPRKVVVAWA